MSIYQPQFIAVSGVKGNGGKNFKFLIQALWDVALFRMVKGHFPFPCARSPDAARTHYLTHKALCSSTFTLSSNTPSLFAPTPRALSLVSTRMPGYPHALSSWDGSLAFRWTLAASHWEISMATRSLFRSKKPPSPSAARRPCILEETVRGYTPAAPKQQIETWMRCSPQELCLPTQQVTVPFSRIVTNS